MTCIAACRPGLAVYSAAIRDGLGHVLHRRLFIVQEEIEGTLTVRQPTLLLDLVPAPRAPHVPVESGADQNSIEHFLVRGSARTISR